MYKVGILLLGVVLAGCSSTPKTPLTEQGYETAALWSVSVNHCAKKGFISADQAVWGDRALYGWLLVDKAYDPAELSRNVTKVQYQPSAPITEEDCRELAVYVEKYKQTVTTHNAAVQQSSQQSQQAYQPSKQTFCNKVGASVLCTTQ